MPAYHVYFLDEAGASRERVEMDCEDDGHAMAQARMLARQRTVELWLGERRLGRIEPQDE